MTLGLRKHLAAVAAIAAIAGLTILPAKADPYNWTGGYVGLSIGGLFGNTDYSFGANSGNAPSGSSSNNGVVGGIYGGYQYQFQPVPVVLGLEGDFRVPRPRAPSANSSGASSQGSTSLGWQSSIRGRVGYAMDRFLPYVTGGVEFGHFDFGVGPLSLGGPNLPICCNFSSTLTGWTVGAGVELCPDQIDHPAGGIPL